MMDKVLVVDDEPDSLEVFGWELSDLGCEVRTASSATEALQICEEFEPTVLVTDYYLREELTGVDIIRRLRVRYPRLRVILISGMRADLIRAEVSSLENVAVLGKPFEWSAIVERLDLAPARKGPAEADSSPGRSANGSRTVDVTPR